MVQMVVKAVFKGGGVCVWGGGALPPLHHFHPPPPLTFLSFTLLSLIPQIRPLLGNNLCDL